MPLQLSVYSPVGWVVVGNVLPGESGSLSDTLESGKREVYDFRCTLGDERSVITKLRGGFDLETGKLRVYLAEDLTEGELIKTLAKGESIEMALKPDASPERRLVKFTQM